MAKGFKTKFSLKDLVASITATFTTSVMNCEGLSQIGIAVHQLGTLEGTWAVWCSNSFDPSRDSETGDVKWALYTLETAFLPPAATGTDQAFTIQLPNFEFRYLRVRFTRTAGTGTSSKIVAAGA